MGLVNQIKPPTLSNEQFDVIQTKVLGACDRMSDGQILDMADALHALIRARQRIRCQHSRVGGGLRLREPPSFQAG